MVAMRDFGIVETSHELVTPGGGYVESGMAALKTRALQALARPTRGRDFAKRRECVRFVGAFASAWFQEWFLAPRRLSKIVGAFHGLSLHPVPLLSRWGEGVRRAGEGGPGLHGPMVRPDQGLVARFATGGRGALTPPRPLPPAWRGSRPRSSSRAPASRPASSGRRLCPAQSVRRRTGARRLTSPRPHVRGPRQGCCLPC